MRRSVLEYHTNDTYKELQEVAALYPQTGHATFKVIRAGGERGKIILPYLKPCLEYGENN
jgi:hypothetical protein